MNLRTILKNTIKRLKKKSIATANLDAVIIVKEALKKDDIFVITNPEYEPKEKEMETIEQLTKKREQFYPIGYLRNTKEFYGFEFYVDENVLIPRPETEMLVDEVLDLSKKFNNPVIVDVGTGSGCIATILAKKLKTSIIATDISHEALKIAYKNAEKLNAKVEFVTADTLTFLKRRVDIIVSNPPYIDEKDYAALQEDVQYEPKKALICKNGTEIIEKLIKLSENLCSYLVLEIDFNQKNFVESFDSCIYVKNDLSNLPRVAVFKFNRH